MKHFLKKTKRAALVSAILLMSIATAFAQLTWAGLHILGDGQVVSQNITLTDDVTIIIASGVATISGEISGDFAIVKYGSGTLNLTGNNSYTGTTTINAGSLNINCNTPLSETTGNIENNAKLHLTGHSDYTYSGVISGTGDLNIYNSTLTLGGENTYTGNTYIFCPLVLDTNGSIASSASVVLGIDGESLGYDLRLDISAGNKSIKALSSSCFDSQVTLGESTLTIGSTETSDENGYVFAGVISGTGGIIKVGHSELYLAGENTYTGITAIEGGKLIIGNGTSSGSVAGNIVLQEETQLVFNRTNDYTYSDTISGGGTVVHSGTGKLTFTGVNSYTGQTVVTQGTLQIGNGISGSIANTSSFHLSNQNSVLRFEPNASVTFSKVVSGNGSVEYKGSVGTSFTFTQDNTYTGSTTIEAGNLHLGNGGSTGKVIGNIINNGHLIINLNNTTYTYSGIISGSGRVTNFGAAKLILTGTSIYTGETVLWGTVQIGNGINGSINNTSNVNLQDNNTVLRFEPGSNMIFSKVISGDGRVEYRGAIGKGLFLTGNNTYTGTTTIESGDLSIGNGGSTGSVTGNIVNNERVYFTRSTDMVYSGIISGAGSVVVTMDDSKLTLESVNTYTGVTFIQNGTLALGVNGAIEQSSQVLFTSTNCIFDVSEGNKKIKNLNSSTADNEVIIGTGSFTIGTSGANDGGGTFAGRFTGNASATTPALIKYGTTTLTLSGISDYSGYTDIYGGTVVFSDLSNFGSSLIRMSGSFILRWSPGNSSDISSRIVSLGILGSNTYPTFDVGTNHVTFSSVLPPFDNTFTKAGAGTLIFAADQIYSGATVVSSGTLQIGDGTSGSIHNTSGVTVNSGAVLRFEPGADMIFSKVISGAGTLQFSGENDTKRLYLTANNSYTGATTIDDGNLYLGNNTPNGSVAGNIVVNGSSAQIGFSRSDDFTYSGVISGNGSLVKSGQGKLTLTGTNTYMNTTSVFEGVLVIGNGTNGSINNSAAVWINADTELRFEPGSDITFSKVISGVGNVSYSGNNDRVLRFTANNTYTGNTLIEAGALFLGNNTTAGSVSGNIINHGTLNFNRSDTHTFSGVISGSGALYQNGSGILNLDGVNTYTGITYIQNGTLALGANGAIENSPQVWFSSSNNCKFDISAGNKRIKNLNSAKADDEVILGSRMLTIGTIGQNDGGGTFVGCFSGTGGVIKNGTATFTIGGTNTATGAFTQNQGRLVISNRWQGNFIKETGAELEIRGSVSIGGMVTFMGGNIYMDLSTVPPSRMFISGIMNPSGVNTLNIASNVVVNQMLFQASSGIVSSPFTVNMPGYTATLEATGTQLLLTTSVIIIYHHITATVTGGNGSITPSGLVQVEHGTNQSFTITPTNGYHLSQVLVDGTPVSTIPQTGGVYTFNNVTGNHSISATFAINTYTISATSGPNGTIDPSGNQTINHGESKIFTITPNTGYHVAQVLVDGAPVYSVPEEGGTYTFNNVTSDHTITATFAINTYTITVTAGPNGMIYPQGNHTLNYGDNLELTIMPNTGYHIAQVLVDGAPVSVPATGGVYAFNNVTANHSISVTFAINTYTITVNAGPNGTINPSENKILNYGDTIEFIITPNYGYHIEQVLVDNVQVTTIPETGGVFAFNHVTANHSISVTFSINTYTILATAGVNGSITPSGNSTVNHGDNIEFTILPEAGYHVGQVLVDGTPVTTVPIEGGVYTFTNVTASHTISVTFAINTYTITATAGPNGIIEPSGQITVNHGTNQSFTITPNEGYRIVQVIVDGVPVASFPSGGGVYTFTNVIENHTISVTFVRITYTITVASGSNGSITPSGNQTINHGDSIVFTISPNTGYNVAQVSVDGAPVTTVPATGGNYTFKNVIANHSISVVFAIKTYIITATAGPNGTINPSGDYTVSHGSNQSFNITPVSGYHVAQVLIDGLPVTTVPAGGGSYLFTNVTENHTISATFAINTYTITVISGPNGTITPSVNQTVNHGASQQFQFAPNEGYHISQVLINGSNNPTAVASGFYTFTNITANQTITVNFAINTYTIIVIAGPNGTIQPPGNQSVEHGADKDFTFHPNTGYYIDQVLINGTNNTDAVTNGYYTFTNVVANQTINVTFAIKTYTITATSGPNGTISSPGIITVNHGATRSYTITPNEGYHVEQVLVDDLQVTTVPATGGVYTFTNVTANHTISATFAINTYTISATAGPNGAIEPPGNFTLNHGDNKEFTITPNPGYHVAQVLVDGTLVTTIPAEGGTYIFTNVIANHTINATFAINTYTITATAGDNGTIFPLGAVSVSHGGTQQFDFLPDSGYHIDKVLIDGVNIPNAAANGYFIFTNVTSDFSIHVTFAINTYTITATAGENGTITPQGNQTINHGDNIEFTIEPNSGYYVLVVLVDNEPITTIPEEGGVYIFANVTENHTIDVTFAIYTYTITATAGENGTITPSGNQTINHGGNLEFTIMPENGYHVEVVLVDDEPVTTIPAEGGVYTFTNVTANHTIEATFAINTYTITATAGENGTITPSGNQTINHGESIEFTITPNSGYLVAEVLVDGIPVTIIPEEGGVYTFTNVTANHTIDVSFVEKEEIDENLLSHVKIYSHKNVVYIKNETGVALKSVVIMDMNGRLVYQDAVAGYETVISLQVAPGIYSVKLISGNGYVSTTKIAIMR